MAYSRRVESLIEAFKSLPGIGPRSAQRLAFHVLERGSDGGLELAEALQSAIKHVRHCERCRMLSDDAVCGICRGKGRDPSQVCVVESPADVMAIENATAYNGHYFVLMGHLSPLDGVGPEELGLDRLEARLREGDIEELILATNPTVEGEATAHYLTDLARRHEVRASRIAHGVPVGGELEYVDGGTLTHAFQGRITVD